MRPTSSSGSGIMRNHHIQALRGVAASLVVLSHAFGPLTDRGILPTWFTPVGYSFGGLGVSTFFVISGFIMISTANDDFGHFAKSVSFAVRRIIRIVPTYWIATWLAFAIYTMLPLSKRPTISDLADSLIFIPYSIDPAADMQPVLGQGWTLNYEMFFYALFAAALTIPRRIGLPALFLAFIGIVAGGAWLKPLSDISHPQTILTFFCDPIILLFAAGMAIGVIRRGFPTYHVPYPFHIAMTAIAAQLVVIVVLKVPSRIPFPWTIQAWAPGIVAVAACAFAAPAARRTPFESLSETLGDASYSTYLFHIFIVFALGKLFPITMLLAVPFVVAALVASNVFGIIFFRVIERPLTRSLRMILKSLEGLFRPLSRVRMIGN
jgi:exopolysaccharide production protein ExoZ